MVNEEIKVTGPELAYDGKVLSYGGWDTVNKLIRQKGWDYLDDVARDTHVSSVLRTRRQKLLRNPWDIIPASERAEDIKIAEFVRWNLNNLRGAFEDDIESMLGGVFYGYSLAEKNWEIEKSGPYAGHAILKSIRNKPVRWWKFEQDDFGNVLSILPRWPLFKMNGPLPYRKFIHLSWGLDDEDPYGDPSASKVAFWQWLKKNGAQFWAVYLERFGMPSVTVQVPQNISPAEKNAVDDFLRNYQSSTGLQIPEGMEVKLLEAVRSGSADYDAFIERCNKEISKEILGVTLAIEEGKRGQGSYALGSVHSDVLDDYTHFDAVKISVAINKQVVKELVDYNFASEKYPVFLFPKAINSSILAQNLESYVKAGMEIPIWWLHREFGIPMAEPGDRTLNHIRWEKPKGRDNRAGSLDFSEKIDTNLSLSEIEDYYSREGSVIVAGLFDKIGATLIKRLTEKERVDQLPNFAVNVGELQESIRQMMVSGALLGAEDGKFKLSKNKTFAEILIENNPYESLKRRKILKKAAFDALEEMSKKRAFTVAGMAKADIEKIFQSIGLTLRDGWTTEEFLAKVEEEKLKYSGTAWAGRVSAETELNSGHLRLVYRNAMMQSFTDGANYYYNDKDVADEIWGFRYVAVGDDRTRKDHLALDGVTLPKGDPFWQKYSPPWDHNCRCDRVPVTYDEIASGTEGMVKPDYLPAGGW